MVILRSLSVPSAAYLFLLVSSFITPLYAIVDIVSSPFPLPNTTDRPSDEPNFLTYNFYGYDIEPLGLLKSARMIYVRPVGEGPCGFAMGAVTTTANASIDEIRELRDELNQSVVLLVDLQGSSCFSYGQALKDVEGLMEQTELLLGITARSNIKTALFTQLVPQQTLLQASGPVAELGNLPPRYDVGFNVAIVSEAGAVELRGMLQKNNGDVLVDYLEDEGPWNRMERSFAFQFQKWASFVLIIGAVMFAVSRIYFAYCHAKSLLWLPIWIHAFVAVNGIFVLIAPPIRNYPIGMQIISLVSLALCYSAYGMILISWMGVLHQIQPSRQSHYFRAAAWLAVALFWINVVLSIIALSLYARKMTSVVARMVYYETIPVTAVLSMWSLTAGVLFWRALNFHRISPAIRSALRSLTAVMFLGIAGFLMYTISSIRLVEPPPNVPVYLLVTYVARIAELVLYVVVFLSQTVVRTILLQGEKAFDMWNPDSVPGDTVDLVTLPPMARSSHVSLPSVVARREDKEEAGGRPHMLSPVCLNVLPEEEPDALPMTFSDRDTLALNESADMQPTSPTDRQPSGPAGHGGQQSYGYYEDALLLPLNGASAGSGRDHHRVYAVPLSAGGPDTREARIRHQPSTGAIMAGLTPIQKRSSSSAVHPAAHRTSSSGSSNAQQMGGNHHYRPIDEQSATSSNRRSSIARYSPALRPKSLQDGRQ